MTKQPQLTRSKLPFSGQIVMFFIRHIQHAMASLGELWRNPVSSAMTMAVLGVSLSLPAALQVLVKNAETITNIPVALKTQPRSDAVKIILITDINGAPR